MTQPSELLVVREGSPARLVCEAVSGHPRPALSWSHPHISPRDLYTRASVTESRAVLSLAHVTRDMAGRYTCHGDNGYSPQPAQTSVQLQVQCELSNTLRKSEILKYVTCFRPSECHRDREAGAHHAGGGGGAGQHINYLCYSSNPIMMTSGL